MPILFLLFTLLWRSVLAAVVLPESTAKQLAEAPLVADILVEAVHSRKDTVQGILSRSSARILKLHRISEDGGWFPQEQEQIQIETVGGEIGETGLFLSGYPRPHVGKTYRAHLKRQQGDTFEVAGLEAGLAPLRKSRDSTRNRTDGSNGAGSGPFLFWHRSFFPIPYFVSIGGFTNRQQMVEAIDTSFQTWRDIEGTELEFLPLGCVTSSKNQNDGINMVLFVSDQWPFDPDAIAITRNFYVSGSGARAGMILDTDILMNAVNHAFTTTGETDKHDVQNILTHEVGHFIGLGHETDPKDLDATMYENAQLNETKKRVLKTGDLQGLNSAYSGSGLKFPQFPTTASCPLERQALSCMHAHRPGDSSNAPAGWIALMLGMLLALGRLIGAFGLLFSPARPKKTSDTAQ